MTLFFVSTTRGAATTYERSSSAGRWVTGTSKWEAPGWVVRCFVRGCRGGNIYVYVENDSGDFVVWNVMRRKATGCPK
jgi:hypothetical protein